MDLLKQKYAIASLAVFLILIFLLQLKIDRLPEKEEIIQESPMQTLPSVEYISAYTGSIVLGGFKPLVINYLWITADKLGQHYQYAELKSILNLTARLQPKVVDVWIFNAHVMAYNISLRLKSEAHQWEWVNAGLEHLYDGLRWNPDDKEIIEHIALIYASRFPQSRDLMDRLEKTTGKNAYFIAAEWYQKLVQILAKKGENKYQVEMWEAMTAGARFYHIFEQMRKMEFDKAIKETDELVAFGNEVAQKYQVDVEKWKGRIDAYKSLKPAFMLEKELWSHYNPETAPNEFFARLPEVIKGYNKILLTALYTDNVPIRARMDALFSPYLVEIFKGIYSNRFDAAKEWLGKMKEVEEKVMIEDPMHGSAFFFNALKERLGKLEAIIQAEEELSLVPKDNEKNYITALQKVMGLYVEYISRYRDLFTLDTEFERMNKLQSVWQKGE